MPHETRPLPASPVTAGPKHHFFGYYDKLQFSPDNRFLLGLETGFIDRPQTGRDIAVIGTVDLENGNKWTPLAETRAWNWQQACCLQWLPGDSWNFIYNDIQDGRFVSIVFDARSGKKRTIQFPVYHVAPNGRFAVSLNFARVARKRPGYGYYGLPDPTEGVNAPENDGIYRVNLKTGKSDLIISLAQMRAFAPRPDMPETEYWFNHLLVNESSERFIFLNRWRTETSWLTRLYTANVDGGDTVLLNDHEMTSHFCWLHSERVLAFSRRRDTGNKYHLFRDRSSEIEIVGGDVLATDGHCSFSPADDRWLLTDTYPQGEKHERTLILYFRPENMRIDIGAFYSMRELDSTPNSEMRCDLHPRWSRDGRKVCFDGTHEGRRGMYLIDVSPVVG